MNPTASTRYEYICAEPLALTLRWDGNELAAIALTWARKDFAANPTSPDGRALQQALETYVQGKLDTWPNLALPMHRLTPFRRTVLTELARVPKGKTLTYGELAAKAGSPKASRAVGQCMAQNPWPLVIPCHRVLGSDGLHGFGPGLEMKEYLLKLEGAL
ncbi:methylated-DNA/protein-cysteine methyltransferase [Desulfovibrio sp. X2]|uniref:methylated-DNA--[protein]-cysteine S-methyltransferase n=1 Tax=Desulfovibrio sp. X2 TaxID=941449 RepID=UPI000358C8CC|nr:methylated-DNA--[protein]-cysteine S-methyltransferase [Desulfovibrio sp. X2]EPR43836.1 methylated-DNA/protein-cysteine methyltransferase [Desulfovibrio sp. X2]